MQRTPSTGHAFPVGDCRHAWWCGHNYVRETVPPGDSGPSVILVLQFAQGGVQDMQARGAALARVAGLFVFCVIN